MMKGIAAARNKNMLFDWTNSGQGLCCDEKQA